MHILHKKSLRQTLPVYLHHKNFYERRSRALSTNFATDIKSTLDNCITDMAKNVNLFAKNPGHDFIRNRKLGFTTLMSFLIGIKGGTLDDEIEDYFSEEEVMSSSAFVQQRNKLNDYAFPHLLQEFNKRTSSYDNKKYNGLFAMSKNKY